MINKATGTVHYDIAAVVINFRTPEMTIDCIKSLNAELKGLAACIVLVDNNSGDGSIDAIERYIAETAIGDNLLIYRSPHNGGFSSGNNIGIRAVEADYYFLTNSDTIIREGALSRLLNTAKSNHAIGLLAPRLEWPDGTAQESCFKYHNPISELINSAKTSVITKLFHRYGVPQPVSDNAKQYDWVSFASVLVNGLVFKNIGLMDEGYFMYYEDVAFCRRAKQAGWLIQYEPRAHVVHLRGGSSPVKTNVKLRKRLPRYFYESRTRFFSQAYGFKGLLTANILWTLGWLIASFRKIVSRSYSLDTCEKQWQDIWINFFDPNKPYIHPDHYGKKT